VCVRAYGWACGQVGGWVCGRACVRAAYKVISPLCVIIHGSPRICAIFADPIKKNRSRGQVCAMASVECVFWHHCVCTYAALWCECSEETASIVRQLRPSHDPIRIGRGLLRAAAVSKK
jgi:hypothetical protein